MKVDRNGQTVYQVGLSAANESGRVELINVAVSGDPGVQIGQIVTPFKLTAFPWEQTRNGVTRSGIAYRADSVTAAASVTADQAAA